MRYTHLATVTLAAVGVATSTTVDGQGRHDDRPHGWRAETPASAPSPLPEGAIALKDGGALVIGRNGVTYHFDRDGHRVLMRDGRAMEAMDGATYVMKNDAVWRTIVEKGTLHPTHQ